MAVFKCKMCGGALEINMGDSVAICEYCNTRQTLPRLDDEKRTRLYDRANYFRRENEFDKAMGIYEMILSDDKEDCESYWGIVLCRYGIEYVEDPRSHKRIPTVNRAQFTSVFDDEDYKNAINYADALQREVYEAEATVIDKIQRGILAISQKEEPFDVFICYKETDSLGNRTQDSVYAQDIYTALTKEGYKVFFAKITLEDKLGSAYEPYIFAALNSAKVMLVVGTTKDNFNAVWVKNEWSRFLSLIKQGKEKTLIPVYKDISPYEMPEEFQFLQSQDMGKIGYLQDLIRGISKLVEINKTTVQETVVINQGYSQAEPLLKRAFMFLEDGDFAKADEFCEQALNIDPENARAYLGKLMVELKVKKQDDLKNLAMPFNANANYQKIIRFADDNLKSEIIGYLNFIANRNEQQRLESIYNITLNKMKSAKTELLYKQVANEFSTISGYKNSDILANECRKKAKSIRLEQELELEEKRKAGKVRAKRNRKIAMIITPVVAVVLVFVFVLNNVIIPNQKLDKAMELIETKDYDSAYTLLEEVGENGLILSSKYDRARELYEAEEYEAALELFGQIQDYKDSTNKIQDCYYLIGTEHLSKDEYEYAINIFDKIKPYKDSEAKLQECKYLLAQQYLESGKLGNAAILFAKIENYKDAKKQSKKIWDKISVRESIAACHNVTIGLKEDGTVINAGSLIVNASENSVIDTSTWENIIAISAGNFHVMGLKSDGTVVTTGVCYDDFSDWKNIVSISAGHNHTVGLKSDGTVVAVGNNSTGQCDISTWTDIVAISAGTFHTVGLKTDGTVVAVGSNTYGQCDVSDWKDIIAISTGELHTVGLKSDGTVVATGKNDYYGQCNVNEWTDIIAIYAGREHTLGLKSDGTVIATEVLIEEKYYDGQCDVYDWTDIVAVTTVRIHSGGGVGGLHTVGLKKNGTVVAVGGNYKGQCNISQWKNIKQQ